MQFGRGNQLPPLGVVFDSDMGARIDTVLALALFYALQGKGETRLYSLSVSNSNLNSARLTDVIARFYAGEIRTNYDLNTRSRTLPVGMNAHADSLPDSAIMSAVLSRTDEEGEPAYPHEVELPTDTGSVVPQIRNALSSLHDANGIVLLAGPATNLAALLDGPGVMEFVRTRVKYLVVSMGAFGGELDEVDERILADVESARDLFTRWPTPIVAVGREIGDAHPFPGSSMETDFAWSKAHPVVDAYRASGTMPYDAPAQDVAAALYAIRPEQGYFRMSEPGVIEITSEGRTRFAPIADGQHRYLIADAEQQEKVREEFAELVSYEPEPPRRRGRRSGQPPQQRARGRRGRRGNNRDSAPEADEPVLPPPADQADSGSL